ncbi:hypothetical protein KSF_109830 [Reticulibacter mediterranei]|uniref:Uncharacterized protein n=1 Tax=Reticulibacter mediterranei TaxID=2778369 RepID=A0A8J3J258_9CHLR|nr:hypothetical protein [Reticulibacter mediterranei]GHP00936.1 hypothetical protein KSF_109830 [Reticulibacter mediterranei]
MHTRERQEQVRLRLPLSARAIQKAITAFCEQFRVPTCSLYVQGHVTIITGELCLIPTWLPVVRPDPELDLLGIGDPDLGEYDDEALLWIAPTSAAHLLLSTTKLL